MNKQVWELAVAFYKPSELFQWLSHDDSTINIDIIIIIIKWHSLV